MLHLIYSYVRAQVRQHEGILTLVQNMQTLGQLFEPLYVYSVTVLPNGKHIMSGGEEGMIQHWHMKDSKEMKMPMNVGSQVLNIAMS